MPTLADLIKAPNAPAALSLWGLAGIAPDVGGGLVDYDTAQAQLAQALKFDPNARLERVGGAEGDPIIGADQGPGYTQFIVHMDNSKLPTFQGAGQDVSKYGGWAPVDPTGQNQAEIANNPAYVVNDPNYGSYTMRGNLKANPNDKADPLWQGIRLAANLAPAVISGGAALLPELGIQGMGMAGSLYSAMQGVGNALGNGGGVGSLAGLLPSLLGQIPGMGAISPYVGLANGIYGAAKGNVGSGLGAGMTLAQLLNNGGGNG